MGLALKKSPYGFTPDRPQYSIEEEPIPALQYQRKCAAILDNATNLSDKTIEFIESMKQAICAWPNRYPTPSQKYWIDYYYDKS